MPTGCPSKLRRSERPDRIFEAALDTAKQAGIVGSRQALDSTPLYDAVATMDTVTLIRSSIRGLFEARQSQAPGRAPRRSHERRRLRELVQAADRLGRSRSSRGAHRQPRQGRLRLPRRPPASPRSCPARSTNHSNCSPVSTAAFGTRPPAPACGPIGEVQLARPARCPGQLGLLGSGPVLAGLRGQADERTGVSGTTPFHDVARVQALASQKSALVAVADATVVLVEKRKLVRGGESAPARSIREIRLTVHGFIMGALHRQGGQGHGCQVDPISP